jgi:hypothetical protein
VRREFFEPDVVVVMEAGFIVIDEDAGGDVHGVDEAESFADPTLSECGLDLRGDIEEGPA